VADPIRIGELRWQLWLVTRTQIADPNGTGIIEFPTNASQIFAKIEAARPLTFYAARQTDTPITHMIWCRWRDYLDNTHAFLRQTISPLDGAVRTEIFRVRRVLEVGGRKRFLQLECELEEAGWIAAAPGALVPSDTVPPVDNNFNTITNPALQP
jgi:head-tail adaptor